MKIHKGIERIHYHDKQKYIFVLCNTNSRLSNYNYSLSWDDVTCQRCLKYRQQPQSLDLPEVSK